MAPLLEVRFTDPDGGIVVMYAQRHDDGTIGYGGPEALVEEL